MRRQWKEGEQVTVSVDNLSSDGYGVARLDGQVVFVKEALPSEKLTVRLDSRRRKIWYAEVVQRLTEADSRIVPDCQHYQRCGGCDLQHLDYPSQVAFKQQRVAREFTRHKLSYDHWDSPLVSDAWHYRRKARIGVRYNRQKQRHIIGFRESGNSHLTAIDECPVLVSHPVLVWSQWHSVLGQLSAPDKLTHIDVTVADNAIALSMRVLSPLSNKDQQLLLAFISNRLMGQDVLPVQLWQQTAKGEAPIAVGSCHPSQSNENDLALLSHQVGGLSLTVAIDDFLQVNGAINRLMVDQAINWLAPNSGDHVLDLFAGHGNFSLPLAQQGCRVTALEVQPRMVQALELQAKQLGLPLTVTEIDLSMGLGVASVADVNAILLDPPRAGAWEVVQELAQLSIPRILYVACDPATMARDLEYLVGHGYCIGRAGIMDMFPQTHHVETMVLLEHRGN